MLEDSITSSPSKTNKSIHKARLLRKNKRKKFEQSIKGNDREKELELFNILHDFYEDSEEESEYESNNNTFLVTKPPAIVENYKPFEKEKSLLLVDRIASKQESSRNKFTFPETQGFLTCYNLTKQEEHFKKQDSTSFVITESELINCCDQAEKVLGHKSENEMNLANTTAQNLPHTPLIDKIYQTQEFSTTTKQTVTNKMHSENSTTDNLSQTVLNEKSPNHQHEMELVNSILQDFSQSPLTKEQTIINTSWQYTPEFRLRRKPIKTYSRQFLNRTRINLSKRLECSTSDDDNDSNSNCSTLSIQEDIAPLEGEFNPAVSVTNTSQRLCENLLSLTAFYTQNSTDESQNLTEQSFSETFLTAASQERLMPFYNIPDLIQEILTIKCPNKLRNNSYNSDEDFYGFSSSTSSDVHGIDLAMEDDQESINKTLITLHDINVTEEVLDMDIRTEASDSESIETDLMNFQLKSNEFNDWNEDDCQDVFAGINTDEILLHHMKSKDLQTLSKNLQNEENYLKVVTPILPKIHQKLESSKYVSFKTASAKTIKVSKEANIMAAKILSKLPDIEMNPKTNNCDIPIMDKDSTNDVNILENPNDYEWNDDCDFFVNFHTPVIPKERLTNTLQCKEKVINDTFSYINDFPSTSKNALKTNIGFQTAAGKKVEISKKAQESVKKLLGEFTNELNKNYSCDKLKEMKTKIYTKTHNIELNKNEGLLTNLQSIDKCDNENLIKSSKESFHTETTDFKLLNGNVGFQTAKGKDIKISLKAQQSVKKLLNEFDTISLKNFEIDLEKTKQEINRNNNKTKVDVIKTVSKNNSNESNKINGFQTSSGKQVKISLKAQQNVEKLLSEFNSKTNNNFENDLEIMKNKIYFKNRKTELEKPLHTEIAIQRPSTSNNLLKENDGFQTANGKKLKISLKAQKSVEQLLKEFNTDSNDNFENDLETLKNNINKKKPALCNIENNEDKHFSENNEDLENIILSEWPLVKQTEKEISKNVIEFTNSNSNKSSTSNRKLEAEDNKYFPVKAECPKNISENYNIEIPNLINQGFQTAKGNKVSISVKAQQAVDKLLQEFRSELVGNNYDQGLMQMKSNIEMKNKQLKQKNLHKETSQVENEYANMILSEWPLSPNKDDTPNETPKQLTAKRKLSIDNSEIPSPIAIKSPPSKIFSKGLYTSKSSMSELAMRSPLNSSPANSIISRKNLLSLTKRRKNKKNSVINIDNDTCNNNFNDKVITKVNMEHVATPIKSSITLGTTIQTPATPNLKEFFSYAPQTSTPRVEKLSKSSQNVMDVDFKTICWDNNESTVNKTSSNLNHSTKLSDSSCSNISLNSPNPTAKERIARLKMYGNAPPVSPILIGTHHNCRPSGLRRTRSMLKKT